MIARATNDAIPQNEANFRVLEAIAGKAKCEKVAADKSNEIAP